MRRCDALSAAVLCFFCLFLPQTCEVESLDSAQPIAPSSSPSASPCSPSWIFFSSTESGGSCYRIFSPPTGGLNWIEAQTRCSLIDDAHLATVHSEEENVFINSLGDQLMLGGSDIASEGRWTWDDGSDWAYTSWDLSESEAGVFPVVTIQPDNLYEKSGGEDCLVTNVNKIEGSTSWYDMACQDRYLYQYVCEMKPSSMPPPPPSPPPPSPPLPPAP
eukprot:CAMPEP_0198212382 /NCGR_PEP_ID=MMETSP1445-20131203/25838_1 /TAXON_ID=36898 /ORGANISM="Pyramimonas sp., Strain CCMP2087" /LENGTH=217 /DNA_ID=CAMNT_0043886813 /DNA_START=279 /DNA_END=928 /DNA_ORIENTATION=+